MGRTAKRSHKTIGRSAEPIDDPQDFLLGSRQPGLVSQILRRACGSEATVADCRTRRGQSASSAY